MKRKNFSILVLIYSLSACGIVDRPLDPKEILSDSTVSVNSEGTITGKFEYREYLGSLDSNGIGEAFESYSTKQAAARLLSFDSYEQLLKANIRDFPIKVSSQSMAAYGFGNLHKGIWAINGYEFTIGIPNSEEVKDHSTYTEESPLVIDPYTVRLYSSGKMKNQDGVQWTAYYFCPAHISRSTCLEGDKYMRWIAKGNLLHKHHK
ncbi:hypothetical protein ACWIUH_09785 [Ursidibacter arcticus]